jgi:hypothetical protein
MAKDNPNLTLAELAEAESALQGLTITASGTNYSQSHNLPFKKLDHRVIEGLT